MITEPVPLRIANGVAYVWNVDDIATLREKYRICGILTGTLPQLSQQNVFLGVPLVLMAEEVVLLVEKGAAVLVDEPIAHLSPTTTQLTKWSLDRKNSVRTQLAYVESKAAYEGTHVGRAISAEAIKKRKEREEKRRAARASKHAADAEEADVEDEDGIVYDSEPNVMVSSGSTVTPSKASKTKGALFTPQFPAILSKRYNLSSLPYVINIPASSSSLEWYSPKQASAIYTTLASAREARIWTYPSTLSERARCGVFKDLWKKGYFMGGGIKFGGEYLVYPGDPLKYHSHFTATVIGSPIASIRPMEIVAHGRLGTSTKKSHLLCSWNDEKQEVSYLTIEWAGFG